MTHTVLHSTSRVSDSVMWDDSQDFPRWSEAAYQRTTVRSAVFREVGGEQPSCDSQEGRHAPLHLQSNLQRCGGIWAALIHSVSSRRTLPHWAEAKEKTWDMGVKRGVHGVLERGKQQEANRELRWEKIQPGNRTEAPIPVLQRNDLEFSAKVHNWEYVTWIEF